MDQINPARARGGSTTAATTKMELFVIIVNGWEPLTIIIKSSILDVATLRSASESNVYLTSTDIPSRCPIPYMTDPFHCLVPFVQF